MIKLTAKLVNFNEISEHNREWHMDTIGIFRFYPQKDCGVSTNVLFDLFEDSNLCDSDDSYFKYMAKQGLNIIKKLGLECEIHVENKYLHFLKSLY